MSVERSALNVERSAPRGEVFLSYAREDSAFARRIADALRGFGVEVWFDQAELRGGDAWDQKIRNQIKECALFVPIISANTQARHEGYFRLEWKLAAQRTHMMSGAIAFLVPVVIDDTRDSDAMVPEEFRTVQWTRLPGGETSNAFCARVRTLLESSDAASVVDAPSGRRPAVPPAPKPSRAWMVPVIAVSILVPGLGIWQPWKPRTPASHPAGGSAHSPAREWVTKARALFEPWSFATQDDFRQAEQFLKRAIELDPGDGEAWAAQAILSCGFDEMGYDRSAERSRNARLHAERAVRLAPDSDYARFALGFAMSNDRGSEAEGMQLLRELIERHPQDKFMLRTLGRHLAVPGLGMRNQFQEGVALLERAAALPGGDPMADFIRGQALHRTAPYRFPEALAAFDRALALAPNFADAYLDKLEVLLEKLGDPEASRAVVEKLPPAVLREDRVVAMASRVWFAVDEPAQILRVLGPTNRYFETRFFTGPTALLRGLAHRRAGRMPAAQVEWRLALQQVEARLEANPNDVLELLIKTRLHVVLGETRLAETTAELAEQLASATSRIGSVLVGLNKVRVVAKSPEEGARNMAEMLAAGTSPRIRQLAASNILFDPELDAQRADPRFAVVIEMAQAFFAEQRKNHGPNP